ncbi:MAG: hypothetical protein PHW73_05220 [Atribacterota bacterium]|nr:hypothetical protein [Atribacterota bacterium]
MLGSYETFDYNYKDGKATIRLREKKDNNIFRPLDLNYIKNLELNKIPNLKDSNTFFDFKLFGEMPYPCLSEKLESDGGKTP